MFKILIFGAGVYIGWRAHAGATVAANKLAIAKGEFNGLIPGIDLARLQKLTQEALDKAAGGN